MNFRYPSWQTQNNMYKVTYTTNNGKQRNQVTYKTLPRALGFIEVAKQCGSKRVTLTKN